MELMTLRATVQHIEELTCNTKSAG